MWTLQHFYLIVQHSHIQYKMFIAQRNSYIIGSLVFCEISFLLFSLTIERRKISSLWEQVQSHFYDTWTSFFYLKTTEWLKAVFFCKMFHRIIIICQRKQINNNWSQEKIVYNDFILLLFPIIKLCLQASKFIKYTNKFRENPLYTYFKIKH